MRIETTTRKVYSVEDLQLPENQHIKAKALEQMRKDAYEFNEFAQWAIDGDYVLEPNHDELEKLYKLEGKERGENILIENLVKDFYFSLGRDHFIDVEKPINVTDDYMFLRWLGLPKELAEKTDYEFETGGGKGSSTTIVLEELDLDYFFSDKETALIEQAEKKFDAHLKQVLKNIEESIDYRFTDEALWAEIVANNYECYENGEKVF